jgi:DNA-binding transcriptional ArsR family regulator
MTMTARGRDVRGRDALGRDARAALAPAAALFRSLGDPTRLAIVRRLATGGEARVIDLVGELGLAQSTVSKHLACLRDCRLVDWRAEGRQSYYSLTRAELLDLLASAEQLLEATGNAVALCPAYGGPGAAPTGAFA